MPGRIIPEPPEPNREPEHLAEERELARSASPAWLSRGGAPTRRRTREGVAG